MRIPVAYAQVSVGGSGSIYPFQAVRGILVRLSPLRLLHLRQDFTCPTLLAIRDGRLYRGEWGTFEEYCRERWGFTRMHASRLITAAEVVQNVTDRLQISPTNIEQTRPLASLPPEAQATAWAWAVETAGKLSYNLVAAPGDPHTWGSLLLPGKAFSRGVCANDCVTGNMGGTRGAI
jgi:hypothetical protein